MENLLAEVEQDGGFDDGKCTLDVRILSFLLKQLQTLPLALTLILFSSTFDFLNWLFKNYKTTFECKKVSFNDS